MNKVFNPSKVQIYSEKFRRFYVLKPTDTIPTVLVSGYQMHRTKDIDPKKDTELKVATLKPIKGTVLDTNTGLGYTAIELSKLAKQVFTIEIDPAMIEVAKQNSFSKQLFDKPNIKQLIGDSAELIIDFPDNYFDLVLHDPPTIHLAGQLYSWDFYVQLHRVLKPVGKLFHYIGNLESDYGMRISKGVVKRLKEAGFSKVTKDLRSFGIIAVK